jgi:hypothetical protein
MSTATKSVTALIARFADRERALRYVDELKRAGFRDDEIGVVTPAREGETAPVEDAAATGVLSGTVLGAVAGAVATALIPGVGPVLATGLLAGAVTGALTGAAAGGVLGTLIGMNVPEEDARRYQEELRQGRTLVIVQALGRGGEALEILRRCEPLD